MSSPMSRVNEIISEKIGDYLTNVNTWGNLMYIALNNGLIGDGVTNDTAALQALVNTAIAAGRKAIYFPHTATGGQYFVTSITNGDQVVFLGDNASFVGGYQELITQLGLKDYTGMKRQAIMNGNFDVWQRGTSFTNPANNTYTSDRNITSFVADGGTFPTVTVSRTLITSGDVQNSFYALRINVNGAGSGYGVNAQYSIGQRIEAGARYLCGAGKKITVSFWAKSDIAGKRIGVSYDQSYGSGGSPSAADKLMGSIFTLTSTWQKFSLTVDTATLAGKTFGTNNDDFLQLVFRVVWGTTVATNNFSGGTSETFIGSGNIDITQVQVNASATALPFQPRSFAEELVLCQRYYEKSYDYINSPGTATSNGYNMIGVAANADNAMTNVSFKIRKRAVPTITLYHSSGTSAAVGKTVLDTSVTSVTQVIKGESGLGQINKTGGFTTGDVVMAHWTADAEL